MFVTDYHYSKNYVFTINPHDINDRIKLDEFRFSVSDMNKKVKGKKKYKVQTATDRFGLQTVYLYQYNK